MFSPSLRNNFERKPSPIKANFNSKLVSRTSAGSDVLSNNKGVVKQRSNNVSPLRVMVKNDSKGKIAMKRDQITLQGSGYGVKNQSPKPRNYSPVRYNYTILKHV